MAHKNQPLVGVFAEAANADHAIEQLRNAGIQEGHIERLGKMEGRDISHASNKGIPEEKKPDFTRYGLEYGEASYYEQQYEAGYTLVLVHGEERIQQVADILRQNDAYNFAAKWGSPRAEAEGAITPAMRGEDASQTGIAITSEGKTSENFDPAAVKADLEHVEEVLEEKYRASEARQNEPPSRPLS
ncbi:MAG: general stress protein [Chloroflexota bacterium]|nr:general stress protein [Chloroflexota bacterium]